MAANVQPGGDVAKPGTTPADATSRPVIVGHTSTVTDPMVSEAQGSLPAKKADEPPKVVASGGSTKAKIAPASDGAEIAKEATKENDEKHAEQSNEKKPDTASETAAKLTELIDSGEYNVTIHQKSGGSALQFFAVVFGVLFIAAVAIYILIDLNIIDAGVKLPFELFK